METAIFTKKEIQAPAFILECWCCGFEGALFTCQKIRSSHQLFFGYLYLFCFSI